MNDKLANRLEAMLHQVGHPDYSLKEFYEGIKLIVLELRQERPPSGEMVMVPREPTEAMLVAASYTGPNNTFLLWKDSAIIRIYRAMLSAAEAEGRKG